MGRLLYGLPSEVVEIEDRALAHLRLAMLSKLRRGESFAFSWEEEGATLYGRSTLWIHPSIPLQFRFRGGRAPAINRAWVEELLALANSANGLRLTPEPPEPGA